MAAWKHAAVFYVAFLGLLGTASASARRDILQNGQCGGKGQACCCDVSGMATLRNAYALALHLPKRSFGDPNIA